MFGKATRMFFATGNGYASQLSDNGPSVPGRQPPSSLEEAVVHMEMLPNGSLAVADFCRSLFSIARPFSVSAIRTDLKKKTT